MQKRVSFASARETRSRHVKLIARPIGRRENAMKPQWQQGLRLDQKRRKRENKLRERERETR